MFVRLPAGNVRRLFLGFMGSTMLLVAFALLLAYNTEAESSNNVESVAKEPALKIAIPTSKPEETIAFYQKLGFRAVSSLNGELDVVSMERGGTPYKLEICHNKFSEAGPLVGGVSGISFPVEDLTTQIERLKAKGLCLSPPEGSLDGPSYTSLKDSNGIKIKLFER